MSENHEEGMLAQVHLQIPKHLLNDSMIVSRDVLKGRGSRFSRILQAIFSGVFVTKPPIKCSNGMWLNKTGSYTVFDQQTLLSTAELIAFFSKCLPLADKEGFDIHLSSDHGYIIDTVETEYFDK